MKAKITKTRAPMTSPRPALPIFSFIHHPRLGKVQSVVARDIIITSHLSEIVMAGALSDNSAPDTTADHSRPQQTTQL